MDNEHIDLSSILSLKNAISSSSEQETSASTHMAQVLSLDNDGTIWVHILGGSDRTPATSSSVSVKPDDFVTAVIENGRCRIDGNLTNKAIGTEDADKLYKIANGAKTVLEELEASSGSSYSQLKTDLEKLSNTIADSLKEVSDAYAVTDAHFYYDQQGAHVVHETQGTDGAHLLANMLGILFMVSDYVNLSITRKAINFYSDDSGFQRDSNGNIILDEDGNPVGLSPIASYSKDGVCIGSENSFHLMITESGIALYGEDGQTISAYIAGNSFRVGAPEGLTVIQYAYSSSDTEPPEEGWLDWTIPECDSENDFLWQRTVTFAADGVTPIRTSNPVRVQGADGESIDEVTVEYAVGLSGVSPPTTGWTTEIQQTTVFGQFLWTRTTTTYENSNRPNTVAYSVAPHGADGPAGLNGKSVSAVINWYLASPFSGSITYASEGWSEEVQQTDETNRYLWNYEEFLDEDENVIDRSTPAIIGTYSKDGVGIDHIVEWYVVSSSASTVPTTGWVEDPPTLTEQNKYLWNYEVVYYTDGTDEATEKRVIGVYGDRGRSVNKVTNHYLASSLSTGVTVSTSGWTENIQQTDETKKYLWNYEELIDADNVLISHTDPVIIGMYSEDGVGIDTIDEWYARSSTNTVPQSGWTTTPPTIDSTYRYLWNYEIVYYTDGTNHQTDKRLIGVYGETGPQGPTGKAATVYYARLTEPGTFVSNKDAQAIGTTSPIQVGERVVIQFVTEMTADGSASNPYKLQISQLSTGYAKMYYQGTLYYSQSQFKVAANTTVMMEWQTINGENVWNILGLVAIDFSAYILHESDGLKVGYRASGWSAFTKVTPSGVEIWESSTSMVGSFYGSNATIGSKASGKWNVFVNSSSSDGDVGISIRQQTTSYAFFGTTARIGLSTGTHITLESNSLNWFNSSSVKVLSIVSNTGNDNWDRYIPGAKLDFSRDQTTYQAYITGRSGENGSGSTQKAGTLYFYTQVASDNYASIKVQSYASSSANRQSIIECYANYFTFHGMQAQFKIDDPILGLGLFPKSGSYNTLISVTTLNSSGNYSNYLTLNTTNSSSIANSSSGFKIGVWGRIIQVHVGVTLKVALTTSDVTLLTFKSDYRPVANTSVVTCWSTPTVIGYINDDGALHAKTTSGTVAAGKTVAFNFTYIVKAGVTPDIYAS